MSVSTDPASGTAGWIEQSIDPGGLADRDRLPALRCRLDHLRARVDGIRVDSVDTGDFVGELRQYARSLFAGQAAEQGIEGRDAQARFLVIGQDLSMPTGLVRSRVDAMWNDEFKHALRAALVGQVRDADRDFEATIRKIIDCRGRIADYQDTAAAINYVTSHDVGSYNSMRLFNCLSGPPWYVFDTERRIKLAFAVLMTAVGVPMIFAGEEFADQHDLPISTGKETDPVNFRRIDTNPWRRRVLTMSPGWSASAKRRMPCVNDTEFIHIDQTP